MNKKGKSTLEKLNNNLRVKNYAKNTIDIYLHYSEVFLNSFNKDIYHISMNEARKFLINYNYTSTSQQNQFISSIKLLYKYVIGIPLNMKYLERPRKEKPLPKVIEKEFLKNQISKIKNLKHKAIISLGFSVGLRVSEVINLKIEDIDSKRMIIHIRNAKGNKDRIVPLSMYILELLREYFKEFKPKVYLFNGQNSLTYTSNSCNKIVKKYVGQQYHFHCLRHSSFTSMLEDKTDISIIQKIAGHKNPKTTLIYTQISNELLKKAKLPL